MFLIPVVVIFYKCLSDQSMLFKTEKFHGGKHSQERVTILLATNVTATKKLKPLVIGKSIKAPCFAGMKTLPLADVANKKAWIIVKLNEEMTKETRKILLFIDNSTTLFIFYSRSCGAILGLEEQENTTTIT